MKGARKRVKNRESKGLDALLMGISSLGFILPLTYIFSSWIDFADYGLPPVMGWFGAVVFISGHLLLWKAHIDLGTGWRKLIEITEGHELVTDGVFKHLRHPIYSAHLIWGLGQALLFANWLAGWSLLIAGIPLLCYRIPLEERMMLAEFGEDYRSYMESTGSLLPRIKRAR